MTKVLAFDFGATSGRAIKASFDKGKISYEEIHRFDNVTITENNHICWDTDMIMREIKTAIKKAPDVDSLAFDTWGVDYGLIGHNKKLISYPINYRDERTKKSFEKAFKNYTKEELYEATGNQIMPINTLFQLLCEDDLKSVEKILFMPDLFSYLLCGKMNCEKTIASTSQMLNLGTGEFSSKIFEKYNIDKSLFMPVTNSGNIIGEYEGIKVISVAGHDTQCAVAAIPSESTTVAFLSCGTWSLIGCELDEPILTKKSMESELSNELGANGRVNYLKNICGLWLISAIKKELKNKGQSYTYDELEQMAREAKPFTCFFDPDDELFSAPGDMIFRITDYCKKTSQAIPQTTGEFVRCIYESLALKYRYALSQISDITNKKFTALHMLGGGTKDKLLCEFTSRSLGMNVVTGPIEATALGNIVIQLIALGEIKDISTARAIIRSQEKLGSFNFSKSDEWEEAYNRFLNIINRGKSL